MRFVTIKDIFDAGLDLRLWCFMCGRGAQLDSVWYMRFEERGWPMELEAARVKFPCKVCRSTAQVLIVPASRRSAPPASPGCFVEYWFHNARKGKLLI